MTSTTMSWDTAASIGATLSDTDRRALLLLARLPLLPESPMERLAGLAGASSIYRTLNTLGRQGLVEWIQPPVQTGRPPRLYYLTSLGLAVIAHREGVNARELARRNRLRGTDLVILAGGLPHLLALYELLGGIAASRAGPIDLLAWERPWRRRYQRVTAKAPVPVTVPAYAALSWGDESGGYLLIADSRDVPLRVYRPTLDRLLDLRRSGSSASFPCLVVATLSRARAAAWQEILEEARRARTEMALNVSVATWDTVRHASLQVPVARPESTANGLVRRVAIARHKSRRGDAIPDLVGDALARTPTTSTIAQPGRAALDLTPADRALLDVIGQHPFLPADDLPVVLRLEPGETQDRRHRLVELGLVRLVDCPEVRPEIAALNLVELTHAGLRLVAAQHGLSLSGACRGLGLVGGGPDQPKGLRADLVRNLAHTLGTDRIFVQMAEQAARQRGLNPRADDALIGWRSAAACRWGYVRPDGYGIYLRGGNQHGFFLEYDRGTESYPRYLQKFGAYYRYWLEGGFLRDYKGYPIVLVVTSAYRREDPILHAARTAAFGRGPGFPLLVTSTWRIAEDPMGPLGPVWHGLNDGPEDLHPWF